MDEAGQTTEPHGTSATSFSEGRYVYCIVDAEATDTTTVNLSVTGIDGHNPHIVSEGGIGAVVHPCESLYDSEDIATVKRWLLQHQTVIDEVGERFGTPIPFRFDTILKGDDRAVQNWLADKSDTFEQMLDRFAGRWEYRIEMSWDEVPLRERAATDDERLNDLSKQQDEASEGTAFLVEKQYERRLSQVVREQRSEELRGLVDDLSAITEELDEVDRPSTVLLDDQEPDPDEQRTMLTALIDENRASEVGDRLDEAASREGVEIRFTGPWPPYSFTPELGG